MKTIASTTEKINQEELLLQQIKDFFDCRSASKHSQFLDYWLELIMGDKYRKQWNNPTDLLFFCDKFITLFEACALATSIPSKRLAKIEGSIDSQNKFIIQEQKLLNYFPNYLNHKSLANPLNAIKAVFKHFSLDFYKKTFREWLAEGLNNTYANENTAFMIPIYFNTKKLIGSCWLIHERLVSKNSYQSTIYTKPQINFALSCPHLLQDKYLLNPYLMVESFFSFSTLSNYQEDLAQWFKMALSENSCYENANNLLFIHHQFTQLINAGYLIVSNDIVYKPKLNYTPNYDTFGHWLLHSNQQKITDLASVEGQTLKEDPFVYCQKTLTFGNIKKIRYYMNEWLDAALSENSSIAHLDQDGLFNHYETMQKLVEAFYLLLTEPAIKASTLPCLNINDHD